MPYLKAQASDRLTLPSDPEFWVEMKRRPAYADTLAAQQSVIGEIDLAQVASGNGHAPGFMFTPEMATYTRTLLLRLITAWNLTDMEDRPLEITRENLEQLEYQDGEFLAWQAMARLKGRPEAAAVPFGKQSSPPSTGSAPSTARPRRR